MSRDKQTEIHEIAKRMSEAISTEMEHRYISDERKLEAVLKENGWCKASDLAEEIFAGIEVEIAKCFKECFKWEGNTTERREMLNFNARIKMSLGKLKKKYTKGGKGQDG